MENTNWSSIFENKDAPYINTLLKHKEASYSTNYFDITHPSEPNYMWMEAGTAFDLPNGTGKVSFTTDADASTHNSTSTTDHLVESLDKSNISWKVYAEGIDGKTCPLLSSGATLYAAKHNPMIFFQDVTDNNNPKSQNCIQHMRPFAELSSDLVAQKNARYNFIIPNLCSDMHDSEGCKTTNRIRNGDEWLAQIVPQILSSQAYKDNGVLFITWDEGVNDGKQNQIGLIALSPLAKGNGYHDDASTTVKYTHGSLLETIRLIFKVKPFPNHESDLSQLFKVSLR